MKTLLTGARIFEGKRLKRMDLAIDQGRIVQRSERISPETFDQIFHFEGCLILPGLVDVHTHLREPGFSYKETIASGTAAAARGGYTAIFAMPNVQPAPDNAEHLEEQFKVIRETAAIPVYPYGTITADRAGKWNLSDYEALHPLVAGFSDDGNGVQSTEVMREAMKGIRRVDGLVAAHCEDEGLINGGYIHKGRYAKAHGHPGIPSESEWRMVERDILLSEETGCRLHICHVSTKESVELIRHAKARGVDVTCETAPHYLALSDEDLLDEGRFKMNPPIRSKEDRAALVEGLNDETIDMIATDHAPHGAYEKDKGLKDSLMGVVGLECAFPVLYTALVLTGELSLYRLYEAMCLSPRGRMGLPKNTLHPGDAADLAAFDLQVEEPVNPKDFLSFGKATPFAGMLTRGWNTMTMLRGEIIWSRR